MLCVDARVHGGRWGCTVAQCLGANVDGTENAGQALPLPAPRSALDQPDHFLVPRLLQLREVLHHVFESSSLDHHPETLHVAQKAAVAVVAFEHDFVI